MLPVGGPAEGAMPPLTSTRAEVSHMADQSNPAQAEAKRVSTSHAKDTEIPPTRKFLAGWGDVDMNGHMRGTAYIQ